MMMFACQTVVLPIILRRFHEDELLLVALSESNGSIEAENARPVDFHSIPILPSTGFGEQCFPLKRIGQNPNEEKRNHKKERERLGVVS
jgi:hypothetical protein